MLTPSGQSVGSMDLVMVLNMWTEHLKKEAYYTTRQPSSFIQAGIGKPTFGINPKICDFLANYWGRHSKAASGYCEPQGEPYARKKMAQAMEKWYGVPIKQEHILFTVGGAGALRAIFNTLPHLYDGTNNFRLLTPVPHYSLYASGVFKLHPIDVMQDKEFQLTAHILKKSLDEARKKAHFDYKPPHAILICDPSNPLGTVITQDELTKIAEVLRHPDNQHLYIILDEAYAEMILDGNKHQSLLSVAYDLKDRIIIMRSATKSLSAAGERMAIAIAFNDRIMTLLNEKNIDMYGHPPVSLQLAYAHAMQSFNDQDRRDINAHYAPKIKYVYRRLKGMDIAVTSLPQGTFYIIANLSKLFGLPLHPRACHTLEKSGLIETDEDICYHLLFKDRIMVAPLSYFGAPPQKGYIRITCSDSLKTLENLMDRLDARLKEAKQVDKTYLLSATTHVADDVSKDVAKVDAKSNLSSKRTSDHCHAEQVDYYDSAEINLEQTMALLPGKSKSTSRDNRWHWPLFSSPKLRRSPRTFKDKYTPLVESIPSNG